MGLVRSLLRTDSTNRGTTRMQELSNLLNGFADVHIHAGPSLIAREFDVWDMVQEAAGGNFAAIVVKDHHVSIVATTRIIQDHLANLNLKVFGGIVLNGSVGGLNPRGVEVAIRLGAKVIWMPTLSSRNHMEKHNRGIRFPSLQQEATISEKPLKCIDAQGRLVPEAGQVLEIVAQHPDVVLATGHGSRNEVDAIVRKGAVIDLRRILVNHPLYMVDATFDDMEAWRSLGAYIEFTAVVSVPSSNLFCIPVKTVAEHLRRLGPDNLILMSD